MRFNILRLSLAISLVFALGMPAQAQDRRDWQSLGQLKAGDKVRLSLKSGPAEGAFQTWTPQEITVGTVTAKKEDVIRIERYRNGGSRGKSAAIGAAVGFGTGFAIGAAAGGCHSGQLGPCVSRGAFGAIGGAVCGVIGAGIGALIPHHTRDLIYSAR